MNELFLYITMDKIQKQSWMKKIKWWKISQYGGIYINFYINYFIWTQKKIDVLFVFDYLLQCTKTCKEMCDTNIGGELFLERKWETVMRQGEV